MAQTYAINLVNLVQKFHSEERCREYLERLRWPEGVVCPQCASKKISRLHKRNQFHCDGCTHQFSVTAGTIMHDTKIPLWKWFLAVYMMVESKKGVSANQLKRTLEVSYRTAWYLCHRIRKALETNDGYLRGVIEVDETWLGGVKKGERADTSNKTLIIGAKARSGDVRLESAERIGAKATGPRVGQFFRANIADDATVYTDSALVYKVVMKGSGREHHRVNHRDGEWVRGDVHTNGIEGAWSLFKRSVVGAYHQLSCKHLPAYLDEFEFRFNNRKNPYIFRDAMVKMIRSDNMEYKELVA